MTSRDYELISAYLDNQLGQKDRDIFEARLKADSQLRVELQEISQTRLLVRKLPKLRAPRNYYIKTETILARPTFNMAPIFGIVSAVASVLLALVIFGSTFFSSSPQVAMAPLAPTNAPLSAQQEVARNATSSGTTTEAAPVVLMEAPPLATSAPNTGALEINQTEVATPTTIYLFAYPPSSTPESGISSLDQETERARIPCDEYFDNSINPTTSSLYSCPTPTDTLSAYLESIFPTSTPSQTPTPTPTTTPPLASTPTPTIAATSPLVEKLIPPSNKVSSTEIAPPNQMLGAGNPAPTEQEPVETPVTPNVSFLNYILLTVEISLAAIAIIAGITAIILRVRAR